jgi:hypothetical protein
MSEVQFADTAPAPVDADDLRAKRAEAVSRRDVAEEQRLYALERVEYGGDPASERALAGQDGETGALPPALLHIDHEIAATMRAIDAGPAAELIDAFGPPASPGFTRGFEPCSVGRAQEIRHSGFRARDLLKRPAEIGHRSDRDPKVGLTSKAVRRGERVDKGDELSVIWEAAARYLPGSSVASCKG